MSGLPSASNTDLLPERLRHPLGDTAVLLAGDEQRIDDPPAVVDGDVAQRAHLPGLGVHLHDRDVRPEGERGPVLLEVELGGEQPAGAALVAVGRSGAGRHGRDPATRAPRGHAGDAEPPAVVNDDVGGARLQLGGDELRGLARAPARRRRARRCRPSCSDRDPPVPPPRAPRRCRTGRNGCPPSGSRACPTRSWRTTSHGPARAPDVPTRMVAVPSAVHLDGAELAAAAGGHLDVDGHADAELPAVARRTPAACSARSSS